ncbi:hypothetical protein GOC91_16530 [Sinorhizobium medicae]|uniref:Uncharacterized protein n=2 Tax=Sinorhizobium medicae TaxID=110321 RepID=A0A508X985_9HYPH|nr:hypothetical protein Smed_4831 [Sinorhizobium medicae WSM419]MDX0434118.1 hypothetical protein [Sinorhizobium medicae]MDX0456687.1 hypothetical protein [Sinorhizobium medicae]MDX0517779.1 hypothetical protein [Sinorhizobium medicae]MDX0520834.1 hypothetical protein [Sinorhizobium medicae]
MTYIAGLSLCRILVAQPGADFTIEAMNVARWVIHRPKVAPLSTGYVRVKQ